MNRLKRIFSLLIMFLLVFGSASHAQERRIGGMVSGILYWDAAESSSAAARIGLSAPVFSLVLEDKSQNFHEFSLGDISFGTDVNTKSTQAGLQSQVGFGVGYNYKFNLYKSKEMSVRPYVMLATGLNVYYLKYKPTTSTNFPYSTLYAGIPVSIGPGFRWQKTEKLFFDFSLPVQLISMTNQISKVEDPSTSTRTTIDFENSMGLKSVQVVFGAGLWLGKRNKEK